MGVSGGNLTIASGSTSGTSSSALAMSNGQLNVNGPATVGNVTLTGGQFLGSAQLSVDGSFDWSAQSQLDANIVQSDGSGTCFNITGSNAQLYMTGGSVQTSCQVSIDNPGFITAGNATVMTTSTLDFATGLQIPVNGGNNGTFTAAGVAANSGPTYGTGADSLVLTSGATTVSAGTTLESGTLTVEAGQTVNVASTGALQETGGSGQIDAGASVTGAGNLELAGGADLSVDAGGVETSGVSLPSGTLTVDSGSTYGTSTTPTSLSGGALVFDGAGTTGNVTVSGGSISGPAQLTVDGSFNWSAQAQLDPNIVQNDGSGTCFNITGTGGQLYLTGGSIQTSCQVSIDNPGFITAGNATVTTTSTLDFATGLQIPVNGGDNGTFTAAGVAANGGPTYGTGADNLVLTGGTTHVVSGNTLVSGPLSIEGSATVLQDDGTVDGAISLSGGTVDGTGTVANSVTNNGGTLAPGDGGIGVLDVEGYTGSGTGTLEIDDSGPGTAGTKFSQLSVSGSVALGGVLELEPTGGYASAASVGDTIPVIAHSSNVSGTFGSVSSTATLPAAETFSATYPGGGIVDAVVGAAQAPSETAPPVLSGTAAQGDQLSVTTGTWSNGPNTFTYQWVDCSSSAGTGCTAINGQTSSTHTLQASDVGEYVTVVVTAHNASSSTPTAQPTPLGPVAGSGAHSPHSPDHDARRAVTTVSHRNLAPWRHAHL